MYKYKEQELDWSSRNVLIISLPPSQCRHLLLTLTQYAISYRDLAVDLQKTHKKSD